MARLCQVEYLGLVPYPQAWALQKERAAQRAQQQIPDTLLLLHHPHTYTLGSAGKMEHLRLSATACAALGVEVIKVDRGGDITYHGPGQLVGYPIFQLARRPGELHADVIQYIRQVEESLILALDQLGLRAGRLENLTGVWLDDPQVAKIAAIGVKVTAKAVTQHGFALNIDPDLRFFQGIIPCGIADKPVTSLAKVLQPTPALNVVLEAVITGFGQVFDLQYPT